MLCSTAYNKITKKQVKGNVKAKDAVAAAKRFFKEKIDFDKRVNVVEYRVIQDSALPSPGKSLTELDFFKIVHRSTAKKPSFVEFAQ